LRPTATTSSLLKLGIEHGQRNNNKFRKPYTVGIDTSIWFYRVQKSRGGQNPELLALFFRCCRLLKLPVLVLFVFNGRDWPTFKQGKNARQTKHWLVDKFRTLVDAFGFGCITAPGEAEAELAYLNRTGIIDAIISEDVDCFLFGAQTVLGGIYYDKRHPEASWCVQVFNQQRINVQKQLHLSQGGFILVGLLCLGDYNMKGLPGCGIQTALMLAQAGLGDRLLTAALTSTPHELKLFVKDWRNNLENELKTNVSGFMKCKHPLLAKKLPPEFPHLDILRAYAHPQTSEAQGSNMHEVICLHVMFPHLRKLAHFGESHFLWGSELKILQRFRRLVWPGAALRAVLLPESERPDNLKGELSRLLLTFCRLFATGIHGEHVRDVSMNTLEYCVEVMPAPFAAETSAGVQGVHEEGRTSVQGHGRDDPPPLKPLRFWLPAAVIVQMFPHLIDNFNGKQGIKKTKKCDSPLSILSPSSSKG
ncbi:PIN domain-like protein, partial [Ramaria rubella]